MKKKKKTFKEFFLENKYCNIAVLVAFLSAIFNAIYTAPVMLGFLI